VMGIPDRYIFEGCVILSSNTLPSASGAMGEHIRAIMGRVYCIDLRRTPTLPESLVFPDRALLDFVYRKRQSVFERHGIHPKVGVDLWDWWLDRAQHGRLRDVSVRSLALRVRLAEDEDDHDLADLTLCYPQ
jgi:hypothetical protein